SPRDWFNLHDSSPVGEASQMRTQPSSPQLARRRPSGLNATPVAGPSWPANVSTSCWPATSHNLTDPSRLHEAIRVPLELTATLSTGLACPLRTPIGLPSRAPHRRTDR